MWMWTPPSSTIRRASAAYSSGVYGIAGHWSRFASAPEMAQVMITGWSRAMAPGVGSRQCHFPLSHAWPSVAREGGLQRREDPDRHQQDDPEAGHDPQHAVPQVAPEVRMSHPRSRDEEAADREEAVDPDVAEPALPQPERRDPAGDRERVPDDHARRESQAQRVEAVAPGVEALCQRGRP